MLPSACLWQIWVNSRSNRGSLGRPSSAAFSGFTSVIGVVVGAVRYKRSKRVCAMLGTIFSIGGAVLYYMLRYQWGFTLFGMLV